MEQFNRDDRPPQGPKPLKLIRIRKGQTAVYTILSPSMWGIWTHWDGQRTLPCMKAKNQCLGCQRGFPKRWKGYLHCYFPPQKSDFLLEITPRAAKLLLDSAPERRMLRGLILRVERSPGGRNGRLLATIVGDDPIERELPAAKDPFDTLAFLWGMQPPLDDGAHRELG